MKVLVTGGTGLLGKSLLETAPSGWKIVATYHRNRPPAEWASCFYPMDLQNPAGIDKLLETIRPDAVIHAASVGSVDEAERNENAVRRINAEGAQWVGTAARRVGAFFLHVSSNAVFDGYSPPYDEQARPSPANRYGKIKLEAEEWVRQNVPGSLIVRPILMYGWPLPGGRDNAVTRWLADLEERRPVRVASDVLSMPLWAANCAEVLWAGILRRKTGTVHAAGSDRLPLSDFARLTARIFGCDESLVQAVSSQDLLGLAPRPKDTSFITARMEKEFGVRPMGVQEGLARMLQSRASIRL